MAPRPEDDDWIERLARWGGALGMNPVRIRWKLRAWQQHMAQRKRRLSTQAQAMTRTHKTCPACNGINGPDDKECIHCGARLSSRQVELARRLLRQMNLGLSAETLLASAYALIYLLIAFNGPQSSLLSLSPIDLAAFGANVHDPAGPVVAFMGGGSVRTMDAQWWRLLTSVFLHGGLMHIAFNIWALLYITPFARQVFGGNKVLFTYVASGVFASLSSLAWATWRGDMLVSIGASGAICGLIGAMVAWGHQQGTWQGLQIRNSMLRWVAYIFIFGLLFHVDHAAHVGGLVAGGLLGWAMPAERRDSNAWVAAGRLSTLACLAATLWIGWLILGG